MNMIRELRVYNNLTMKQAAEALGLPYTTYVNYEKGTREPNSETLKKISDFYKVTVDYLLGHIIENVWSSGNGITVYRSSVSNRLTHFLESTDPNDYRIVYRGPGIIITVNNDSTASEESINMIVDAYRIDRCNNSIANTHANNTNIIDFNIPNIDSMPEMRKIPLVGTIACGDPILAEENIEDYVEIPKHIKADFALTCKGDSMINARIFNGDIVYIRQQETVENGEIAAVLIDGEATLKRIKVFDDHIVLEPENPMYKPFSYWNEEMNNIRILGKAVAFTSAVR